MSDADVIAQARWQGGVDAKLDAVLARIDAQALDAKRMADAADEKHETLAKKVDSLEAFRDRAIGVALGSSLGGGLIGGGLASLASYLLGT